MIRRRGKESWELRFDIGRDPQTGKRRFRYWTVRGTKKQAEQALTDAMHKRDTGFDVAPAKVTVAEYLERWLRDYAEVNVAPATLRRYQQIVTRLKPLIGAHGLQALRPTHIQDAYARLLAEGLARRTVLHHHRVLHLALRHAMQWQLLAHNAADATTPPRPPRTEMQVLAPEEIRTLLDACEDDQLRTVIFTAVGTGMRIGELLGLRWSDLDLTTGAAHIVRAAQYLPRAGVTFRTPKTARSRRNVALSPDTLRALREHRARQAERRLALGPGYDDGDLVFASIDGRPLSPNNVSQAFLRLEKRIGVGPVRFHDLRHTAATLMLQAGVHPKVVSERLGHSTINLTLDTYSHVLPEMQRDAALALDRVLSARL